MRSPVKVKSPSRQNGGWIQSFQTAVADIVISIIVKPYKSPTHKEGAYFKPLVDAWRDNTGVPYHVSQWDIDSIVYRRDSVESNEPMKTGPGSPYNWECIVTLKTTQDEKPEAIGQKLSNAFSSFRSPDFDRTFSFKGDISADEPLSLNHYLMDCDCVMYLKKIYYGVSKEDIMEDDGILTAFFNSPELGRVVLSGVPDEEWERDMWNDMTTF